MSKAADPKAELLPPYLEKQVDSLIDLLRDYNTRLPKERRRKEEDYKFLHDFFPRFLLDQNKRANEISSKTYQKAVDVVNSHLPSPVYWDLCIDGRVLTILMHGMSAPDYSLRVPAGMLRDFVRDSEGRLVLMHNSNFAMMLHKALKKQDEIVEVFDSHLNCNERRTSEEVKGLSSLPDDGLVSDVLYKKEMADALGVFIKEDYGKKKRVIPVQVSFDPSSGFMYMGLETDKALKQVMKDGSLPYSYVGEKGYTGDVLSNLVEKGIIFSTKRFANETEVVSLFKKHAFSLDWKSDYVESTVKFWDAISMMKDALIPLISKHLVKIYPDLSKTDSEMKARAMLLLSNAFSGYLHTHHVEKIALREDNDKHYPYGIHEEEGIKISEGGFPPYEIAMFSVYSGFARNLPARIELATGHVRSNRKRDVYSIPDRARLYSLRDDFVGAPVPIVVQELVGEDLSEDTWDELSRIDWSDMPVLWNMLSDVDFLEYLEGKGISEGPLLLGINNLRNTMGVLYSPERRTSNYIVEHHVVALPVIIDRFRKNRVVIPFVKLGFI